MKNLLTVGIEPGTLGLKPQDCDLISYLPDSAILVLLVKLSLLRDFWLSQKGIIVDYQRSHAQSLLEVTFCADFILLPTIGCSDKST